MARARRARLAASTAAVAAALAALIGAAAAPPPAAADFSKRPITAASFARARHLQIALAPAAAGVAQRLRLPRGVLRYVAIRAVDSAGNVGLPLAVRVSR